jgi:RimJ/RimL family protein N-acetyltransferase
VGLSPCTCPEGRCFHPGADICRDLGPSTFGRIVGRDTFARHWPDPALSPDRVALIDVYARDGCISLLWEILESRAGQDEINISHHTMPTPEEHVRFVQSRPYLGWYFVTLAGKIVMGAVYVTRQGEIGIHLLPEFHGRGYGPEAIRQVMFLHPREQYLANVNPKNERSIRMFEKLGFRFKQATYALEAR